MSDYDLGRAYGRIEIESDVDTDRASKGLNDVSRSATVTSAAMSKTEGALQKLEVALARTQHRLNQMSDSVSRTTRRLGEMSAAAALAAASMTGLGSSASEVGRNLVRLGQRAYGLHGTFRDLTSVTGLATAGLMRFTDVGREFQKLPRWAKAIQSVSTGMKAAGAGLTLLTARSATARAAIAGLASQIGAKLLPAFVLAQTHSARFRMATILAQSAAEKASGTFRDLAKATGDVSRGMQRFSTAIGGFVLLKSAFNDARKLTQGLKTLVRVGIMPLAIALAGLASIKFLPALASGILNIVGAVKTLTGALAILPGSLAVLGTIGITAAVGIKTLSAAFKAGFGDAKDFDKAVEGLSPRLRGFARELQDVKEKYEGFGNEIAETSFSAIIDGFKDLALFYLPILKGGLGLVAQGLGQASAGLVRFLSLKATMRDFGLLFAASGRVANNFGRSLEPLLIGLRNIGTVGAIAFANLSNSMFGLSDIFRIWTERVRSDGSLKRWIDNGVQGFRDLFNSIQDFSVGLGSLFRILGGHASGNPLGRMADAADRFRKSMDSLQKSGGSKVFDALRSASENLWEKIEAIGEAVVKVVSAALPAITAFSDAFSDRFVGAIEMAASILSMFAKVLSGFDGFLGGVIGTVIGATVAFKAVAFAVKPVVTLFKAFAGAAMLSSLSGGLLAVGGAMEKVAGRAGRLSGPILKARDAMLSLAAAGPGVMIGITAVIAGFMMMKAAADGEKQKQKEIQDGYRASAKAAQEFGKEVRAAGGEVSSAAWSKAIESAEQFRETMSKEEEGPSFGERLLGAARAMQGPGAVDTADEKEDQSKIAQGRNRAFNKVIGDSAEELAAAATSSQAHFDSLIQRLHALGDDGVNAAAKLKVLRGELMNQKLTADAIGKSNLDVANGIRKMADESSSAADKLSALKQVLQGLGFFPTDARQALADYTLKINELTQKQFELADASGAMGAALFDSKGQLNLMSTNGAQLNNELIQLAEQFFNSSIATKDAGSRFNEMRPILEKLGQTYGVTGQRLESLIQSYGFVPETVQTIISVIGADKTQAEIVAVMLQLQNLPEGKFIPISVEDQGAKDQLAALGVEIKNFNPETKAMEIKIPPGLGEKVKTQIVDLLNKQGLKIEAPIEPVPAPAGTGPAAKPQGQIVKADPNPQPGPQSGPQPQPGPGPKGQPQTKPPQQVTTTVKVEGWESSEATLKRIKSLAESLKSVQASITVKVVGWDSTEGTLNRIKNLANSLKSVQGNITVRVVGWDSTEGTLRRIKALAESFRSVNAEIVVKARDEATGVIDSIRGKVDELAGAAEAMRDRIVAAFNQCVEAANRLKGAIEAVRSTMDTVAAGASARGASLGEGFAQGIESKVGRVQAASMKLAEAARRPLPSSPAKIGPFSGRGWTPFRGRKLAEGFAQGIHAGADTAEQASLDMVSQIVRAMDSVRVAFGITPTYFDENRTPGPGGKKYYRDPNVTDEDLRQAREEKKKQDEKQARLDAEKAADAVPKAKADITKAEDTVRKAEERLKKAEDKGKSDDIRSAKESLDKAKGDLQKRQNRLKELESTAQSSGGTSSRTYKATEEEKARLGGDPAGIALWEEIKSANPSAQLNAGKTDHVIDNGYHPKGKAVDISLDDKQKTLDWARANRGRLRQVIYDNSEDPYYDDGNTVASGAAARGVYGEGTMGQHANHIHIAAKDDFAGSQGRAAPSGTDSSSGSGSKVRMVPIVKRPDGTYGSPDPAWDHLIQRESGGNAQIVQGVQDANSGGNEASGLFQIAKGTWASNGGTQYAATAGEATPEQQAEIAARIFDKSGGSPWGAGLAGRESEDALRAGLSEGTVSGTGDSATTAGATTDTVAELRKTNSKLDRAITIAQNPNSSEGEVIRALQDIDDAMVTMTETEKDSLEGVRSEIMANRGIKEYDPNEGAPKTPKEWFDTVFGGIMQNLLGLYNTIEQGMQQAVEAAHLISRGVSSTDDVHTMVDGIQGLVNSAMQVMTTVGSLVQFAGNIAAAAGSAIPGIGQIGSVIGSITGVVGDVNSVIDFAQEVAHIGGRWFGKGLSSLIGFLGGTGELQGQIRTLMDMNDNTIKTWSDRNTADKAIIGMGGQQSGPGAGRDPNQTGSFRDLNIYQGPGSDPAEMMNNAMFAVAAHSQGVYS